MSYNPILPPGQANMANSAPVVLASDQTDVKITLDGEAVAITGSVTTTATNLDIRDLVFATDKVDVSGSTGVGVTGTFWQATQPVSLASLPSLAAGTNNIGDVDVLTVPADPFGANADVASATGSISAKLRFIASTGIPITGTVTVGTHAVTQSGTWDIGTLSTITNVVHIDDNAGSLTVDGTVAATQSGTWILGANSGIDIGDVTINNASGVSAVNIQDGGNSITVDGTVAFSNSTIAVTNAGTFVVQENGSALTALQLIDDGVAGQGAALGTFKNYLMGGSVTTAAPTYTTGNINPLSLQTDGSLRTSVTNTVTVGTHAVTQSGTWNIGTLSTITNVVHVDDNASTLSIDDGAGSITVDGTVTTTNAGTFAVQDSQVVTDNGGFTDGTTKLFVSGFIYDEVAGTALTENDAAAGRINVNRAIVNVIEDGATRGRYATVTAANAIKVDGSGVTQPVSLTSTTITGTVAVTKSGTWDITNAGTFAVQAAQSGTWTVQPGNTANTTAWLVTGTGGTFPATQSGNWSVRAQDGSGNALTSALRGSERALSVQLVDGSGTQITTFGGGTEYTEDAIAPADPTGGTLLMTRDDQLSTVTEVEGDWSRLRGTSKGALWVAIADSAGDPITSFGGGTQYTEDVAAAADPVGNMMMAVRLDTLGAITTTDGDNIALRATNKGEVYVKHVDAIPITDNAGSLTVDGTVAFSNTTIAVTNAGTFVTQENGAALTSLQLIDDVIYTDDTSTHATGTTKGAGIMAVANPTDAAVDANDIGMVAMTLARALKNDITTIAGTAPTTAGFIDIKGADGNVFVRQATASNLNMTEASAASILTSVQLIDDTVVAQGTALGTTKVSLIGGSVTTNAPTFTTGQINQLSLTTGGGLRVSLADTAANTTAGLISVKFDQTTVGTTNAVSLAQLGANTVATGNGASSTGVLRVAQVNDGTGVLATVNNVATIGTSVTPGTGATNLGKAEDAAHTTGDVGVMMLGVRSATASDKSANAADGDYEPLLVDANGRLHVINSAGIAGDVASGSADSGNPVKIGFQARTTNPTAVTDGQRVTGIADKLGRQVTVLNQVRDLKVDQTTTITASTTETTVLTAVASTFLDVVMITIANTSATDTRVDFRDSTGGSVRFSLLAKAGQTTGFVTPDPINQTTVNNNWTAQCGTSVTDVRIYVKAVKNI